MIGSAVQIPAAVMNGLGAAGVMLSCIGMTRDIFVARTWRMGVMGQYKQVLEGQFEDLCTCGGGGSFATEDHDEGCPAQKYIIDMFYTL